MKKVKPFSNSSEAVSWMDNNCDKCKNKSCYKRTCLQMGFITGDITINTAKFIGYNNLHNDYVNLNSKCNHIDEPVIKNKSIKIDNNQQKLF